MESRYERTRCSPCGTLPASACEDLLRAQQLGDGNAAQSPFAQAAKNLRERCSSEISVIGVTLVTVVHEHDVTGCDSRQHACGSRCGVACERVAAVERPCNNLQLAPVCDARECRTLQAHRRSIQRLGSGPGQFLNQPSAAFDVGTLLA